MLLIIIVAIVAGLGSGFMIPNVVRHLEDRYVYSHKGFYVIAIIASPLAAICVTLVVVGMAGEKIVNAISDLFFVHRT